MRKLPFSSSHINSSAWVPPVRCNWTVEGFDLVSWRYNYPFEGKETPNNKVTTVFLSYLPSYFNKLNAAYYNAFSYQICSVLICLHRLGKEGESGSSSPYCCWRKKWRQASSLRLDGPPSSCAWPTGSRAAILAMLSAFLCEEGRPLPLLTISTI